MSFHLLCELPVRVCQELREDSSELTEEEVRILKRQIRRNALRINQHVARLDLFVNKEKYPRQEEFLHNIRQQMSLLMEENDTFRRVLWKHCQNAEANGGSPIRRKDKP